MAEVVAGFLIQPGIFLSFQKNVTNPAWLTAVVIVIGVPLLAVVADAVSEIETSAGPGGAETQF